LLFDSGHKDIIPACIFLAIAKKMQAGGNVMLGIGGVEGGRVKNKKTVLSEVAEAT
jgi:hypothetical protein